MGEEEGEGFGEEKSLYEERGGEAEGTIEEIGDEGTQKGAEEMSSESERREVDENVEADDFGGERMEGGREAEKEDESWVRSLIGLNSDCKMETQCVGRIGEWKKKLR